MRRYTLNELYIFVHERKKYISHHTVMHIYTRCILARALCVYMKRRYCLYVLFVCLYDACLCFIFKKFIYLYSIHSIDNQLFSLSILVEMRTKRPLYRYIHCYVLSFTQFFLFNTVNYLFFVVFLLIYNF